MADPILVFLKRFVLLLLAGLIGMSIYFVWCASGLVLRVDRTIVVFSDDFKQMTTTAAQISGDISEMRDRLQAMEESVRDAVPLEAFDSALEELQSAGKSIRSDTGTLDPETDREIKLLLKGLASSGLKFEERGKSRPISYLYARLYAKYRSFRGGLSTTEEFIEQVATKTILGNPYTIVDEEGTSIPLNQWMQDRLKELRELGK